MKETQAIIERVRRVNELYQQLDLSVDASLTQMKAGQSLLARVGDGWEPYLRDQWWPAAISGGIVTVELPVGVKYEPGQVVDLIGIVGQPYRFRRTLRNVLLLAYDTDLAPFLLMLPALLANRVSVTLVLLGSAATYSTGHLAAEIEVITGDGELNWANRVTTIGWADQVFVITPQDDGLAHFKRIWDLFSQLRAEVPASYLFAVVRMPLPCGVGACSACMVRTKGANQLICTNGPAFDMTQMLFA